MQCYSAMQRRLAAATFVSLVAVVAACAPACAKRGASSKSSTSVAKAPVATPAPQTEEESDEQVKRPRFREAAVYIDGRATAILRRPELPTSLKGRTVHLGGGYDTTRYALTDYATSLGIDPKKIRGLHLYGGSRMVVIDDTEFKRWGDKLMFSFVGGDRGKPRVHFPSVKINVNTTIDMLSAVIFYVEKEPPHLGENGLVMPDGSLVGDKVPYAPEEQGSGTRVYVDGVLVGAVKRKKLTNDVLVPGKDDRFSLSAYAAKLGVDPAKAKAIDLVAGDDVVAHLAPEAAKAVSFQVPRRNQGQILAALPEAKTDAKISAVQIYVKSTPPVRPVVALDDAPESTPSAGGQNRGGHASDDE